MKTYIQTHGSLKTMSNIRPEEKNTQFRNSYKPIPFRGAHARLYLGCSNMQYCFSLRVACVIILLYYSFGIIGIECFSGLQLKDCCQ